MNRSRYVDIQDAGLTLISNDFDCDVTVKQLINSNRIKGLSPYSLFPGSRHLDA